MKEELTEAANEYFEQLGSDKEKLGSSCIQFNTMLKRNCPVWKKFLIGMKETGFESVKRSGFFAWHGSSEEAIASICRDGFDPKYRRVQAYGTGEYFSMDINVTKHYLKQCSRHIILTYILNKGQTRVKDRYCYVINNPEDFHSTYCLPLFVFSVGGYIRFNALPIEE